MRSDSATESLMACPSFWSNCFMRLSSSKPASSTTNYRHSRTCSYATQDRLKASFPRALTVPKGRVTPFHRAPAVGWLLLLQRPALLLVGRFFALFGSHDV